MKTLGGFCCAQNGFGINCSLQLMAEVFLWMVNDFVLSLVGNEGISSDFMTQGAVSDLKTFEIVDLNEK